MLSVETPMNRSKRKVPSHITDEEANRILRAALPAYWSIRDYKPDYGIDLAIELFDQASGSGDKFDTLGEHLFVQVKGAKRLEFHGIKENLRPNDKRGPQQLSVIKFQIETPELVRVQRMGPALPVLLVLIETSSGRIFFVSLMIISIKYCCLMMQSIGATRRRLSLFPPITNSPRVPFCRL